VRSFRWPSGVLRHIQGCLKRGAYAAVF